MSTNTPRNNLETEPQLNITFTELVDSLAKQFDAPEETVREALGRNEHIKDGYIYSLHTDSKGNTIIVRERSDTPKAEVLRYFMASSGTVRPYNKETKSFESNTTVGVSVRELPINYRLGSAGLSVGTNQTGHYVPPGSSTK